MVRVEKECEHFQFLVQLIQKRDCMLRFEPVPVIKGEGAARTVQRYIEASSASLFYH